MDILLKERITETTDTTFLDQEQPNKWAKDQKGATHSPATKNIYTGKNQDTRLVPAPEM